ncbi:MAG: hypothetical protein RIS09_745, partial [Actinomycetota bacterium]
MLKLIKDIGIWGYIMFGVVGILFVIGETFETPGTTNPWIVLTLCVVPLLVMLFLVFKRVVFLQGMFIAFSAVLVLLGFATTGFPDWWLEFRDTNGPVLGVATLVLSFVMAFWARQEPKLAGLLILFVTAVPFVTGAITEGGIHLGGSTAALTLP